MQGTYKFFSLVTGKKIKRRSFTTYPIPTSVIKKAKTFGAMVQNTFDFADRNCILFEWNDELDAVNDDALLEEGMVLYPSIEAEFPGVVLTCDILTVEEEIELHGRVKELATQNAFMAPVTIAGVNAPCAIPANKDKYEYSDDNNDGIIRVQDIPTQNPAKNMNPVIPLKSDNEQDVAPNDNKDVNPNNEKSINDDNDDDDNDDHDDDYDNNNNRTTERDMPQAEQEATTSYE